MEPISIATATGTAYGIGSLFSYLAQYFAERASNKKAAEQATIEDYIEWLRRNNHQQVVDLIKGNADLSKSIKALLDEQYQTVIGMLQKIDAVVGSVAAGIDLLRPIAQSTPFASNQITDSPLGILKWLAQEGFSGFLEVQTRGDGLTLVALGNANPRFDAPPPQTNYDVLEPQFFEDDVATLVEMGLLRLDYNGRGDSLYFLTRSGEKVAKAATVSTSGS